MITTKTSGKTTIGGNFGTVDDGLIVVDGLDEGVPKFAIDMGFISG